MTRIIPHCIVTFLLFFVLSFALDTQAQTRYYVKADATGTGTGLSWQDAYTTLTAAITKSVNGNEIWVAKGTYYSTSGTGGTFTLKTGVQIYGGFAGTETLLSQRVVAANGLFTVNESILHGQDANYHVVSSANNNATLLDGFTITRGLSAVSTSLSGPYIGAGIYVSSGAAIFQNLWIKENNASAGGGGIYNAGVSASFKNLIIENNNLRSVTAGAGIYNAGASATFEKIIFKNNTGAGTGGGFNNTVAGVTMTDVSFEGHSVTTNGGGLFNSGSNLTINRASFIGNYAGQRGAGMYSVTGTGIVLSNSVFSQNVVTGANVGYLGGGLNFISGSGNIYNCTFSNNTIGYAIENVNTYGAGLYSGVVALNIYNSVFWNNRRGGDVPDQLNTTFKFGLYYNLIQGGLNNSENTIIGNPEFENALTHNLRLKNGSIAINAGINSQVVGGTDAAGNTRIVNAAVDLGAYEHPIGSPASIVLQPSAIGNVTRGIPYQLQLSTNGSGAASFQVTYGSLPPGIKLNAQTGLLSGIAMVNDDYTFVVKATQGGQTTSRQYTINVNNAPARLHVRAASTTGDNSGANWADAYVRLQTAIEMAKSGDEIWVAKGTYSPVQHIDSTFNMVSGVKIYGGFAGTETVVSQRVADAKGKYTTNETILSGNYVNVHVVNSIAALTPESTLDGFTITAGNAVQAGVKSYGGGIYINTVAVNGTYSNLIIKNNNANTYGAGMYNASTAIRLKNVSFENNVLSTGTTRNGGGLYNTGANLQLNDVDFKGNQAINGGGMWNNVAGVAITKATFEENVATNGAGLHNAGTININQASFLKNTTTSTGAGIYGTGTITVTNSIFSANSITGATAATATNGAGMYFNGAGTITNCTFSNNITNYTVTGTTTIGAGLYAAPAAFGVYNSIFWGNKRGNDVADQIGGTATNLANNLIQDNYIYGTNNLIGNPEFENALTHDLRLKNGSVAINAGNNAYVGTANDLAGNTRIIYSIVDLGAYENPNASAGSLTIQPATLAVARRGTAYSQQFSTSVATGAITWDLTNGTVPLGMLFNKQTGILSGVPMYSGAYTFVIKATQNGTMATRQYNLQVNDGATRWHVKGNATGANNGADWTNGLTRLQSALGMAKDGDEIWVAKGVYTPAAHVDSTFVLVSGVKMYGGFSGTETLLSQRIADANGKFILNNAELHGSTVNKNVVSSTKLVSIETLLDGFTVSGGNFPGGSGAGINILAAAVNGTYKNLIIKNNTASTYGAGMYNAATGVKFDNILFEGNVLTTSTRYGGGLYNTAIGIQLNNITFRGNQAVQGGGMYNVSNNVTINNVVFENNTATTLGAGLVNTGTGFILNNGVFENNIATGAGGGFNTTGSATLTDVVFRSNRSNTTGAGISGSGTLSVDRGLFVDNIAVQSGGGIYMNSTGSTTLTNVAFSRNAVTSTSTSYYGGGVYAGSATSTNIVNATFSKNTVGRAAVLSGAGLYRAAGTVNVTNSILWGNTRGGGVADQLNTAGISVANSTIEEGFATGSAVLVGDPLFTDPDNDNLILRTGSLAIDKGNNAVVGTTKDIDGNPRIYNSIVDHGAYENQGGASLKIAPTTLGTITRGALVDIQMTATGGTGPFTWSILTGELPLGLSISPAGRIYGRVMKGTPGGDTFVISVTNAMLIGSKQFSIDAVPGPARFYVKQNATGKATGANWTDAFTDLQSTLSNYVVAGDEIWVAKGTYLPGTTAAHTFTMKSGVKWYGGFAGTENELTERVADANKLYAVNETILSGNGISNHVVTNVESSTNETVVDGFSITGGRTATGSTSITNSAAGIYNNAGEAVFRNLWVKNNYADRYGAGIYNNGPATFENIRIEKNMVTRGLGYGGGLYNQNAFVILRNLTFVENEATLGGGMYNAIANLTAENLSFLRNKAITSGAGLYHSVGMLNLKRSLFEGNAVIGNGGGLFTVTGLNGEDLIFKDNTATTTGAGMNSAGTLTLNRVSFIGNTSAQYGAGLYNNGTARLDNVVFSQNKISTNSAVGFGVGMYNYAGASVLSNTTFSNNTSAYIHATTNAGAGFYLRSGSASIYNSIFWGNKRGNGLSDQITGVVTVANSIVENGYAGGTKISIGNPLFTDAATNNLKIKGGSAAIDVGDNAASGTAVDLANLPRVVNGIVDLGAYENQGGESLLILPASLPTFVRGTNINTQFTATGGGSSLTWSISSGTLPTGLSFSSTGLLSGRTMYVGSYTFVVSVTDGEFAGTKQFNVVVSAGSTNIYVSEGATAGRKDGSSWSNAFTDLQLALGQSTAGDQIWVAKGNYSPGLLATSTFAMKENVKVYGGFAGTEENLAARDTSLIHTTNKSILDGSQGVASYHVVSSTTAVTSETILDGFTISGGRTLTTTSTSYPNVPDQGVNYYGAGIYTSLGRPIFNNLIITNNTALFGAGAFVLSGVATFTNTKFITNSTIGNLGRGAALYNHTGGITVDNVLFEGNFITSGSATYGGAIFNSGTALISNSTFKDNITNGTGYAYGGALYSNTSSVVKISNTSFIGNQALNGAAVYNNTASPEFTDVTFKSNRSRGMGGAVTAAGTPLFERVYFIDNESTQHGGALYTSGAARLNNVVFSRNRIVAVPTAAAYGGAMFAGTTATLTNVTFSNNSISRTAAGGGALFRSAGTVSISNSIFWGNTRADGVADQIMGVVTIDRSIVQNGIAGGTNIAIGNPLFNDAAVDNLRLRGGSPAIDMGDNAKVSGATDVEGNLRIYNDIVDMGAFENQGTASLIISPATLQAYSRGDLMNVPLTVSAGGGNLVWSITSGTLPLGLGLEANGILKGRPLEAGTFTFVVGVTDGSLVGRRQYTLLVNQAATQLFVNVAAVSGRNDGSSWEHGYTDLKLAITKAITGDQIWVAKGTYSPGLLATSWFTMKEGVKIYGGFAGTETTLNDRAFPEMHTNNQTILDGSQGVASRHVVFNNIALSNTTLLDGFTISGGQGLAGTDSDNNRGAGIYNYAAVKAIFSNLRVINNKAERGAGIYNMGTAVYDKILFEGNEANSVGGGFFNLNANVTMTDVIFRGNTAKLNSGGLSQSGGVLNIDRGSFIANTAGQQAGGMYNTSGTANLSNVIFSRNAVTTAGAYYGGGMFSAATTNLNNVTFSENKIAFTHATTIGGAGLYRSTGVVTVNNGIFWGNTRGNNVPDQLTAGQTVRNSIVQGGYATGTNILIGNPLFNNATQDDLQLKGGSPAIDAGDNSSNTTSLDLAGNPRITNDIIDFGAYESLGGNGLKIQPTVFPSSVRGLDPNFQMSVTGGAGNYTWTLQSGTLPTGLVLTAEGLITGRPTVPGTYTFVISVTDGTLVGSKQFNAVITDGPSRLYVRQAATGNNNGSNWTDAFIDLQIALTQSKAGDEIWVAKGTYYTGPLASSYFTLKEGVKMYGGFAGTEALLAERNIANIRTTNETILDGSQGTPSYHVIYNTAALSSATVLDGFSIQNGKAAINSTGASYYGGGIYNTNGAVVFNHLWIKNNIAAYGGGLFHSGNATYTDIIFSNNQSKGTNARGAAVYNQSGFKLTKGVFQNNQLLEGTAYGAAIFNSGPLTLSEVKFENNIISNGQGGAIYSNSGAVVDISKTEFTGNRATTGGAIFLANGTTTFTDVQFNNNTATTSAGAVYAAGVVNINRGSFINNSSVQHGAALWSASTLKIDNTVFSRNNVTSTAGYYGAAIFLNSGNALINNTSFSNNSIAYNKGTATLSYGGAIYRSSGTATINNSIFWGNKRGNDVPDQINAGIVVGTSIVQNGYATGTDIKIGDPMFENAAADNLKLKGGSLAIDAGENNLQVFDKDLSGNPRVVNGTIDLGAYEQDGNGRLMIGPAVINSIPRGTALNLQLLATGTTLPVSWTLQTGKLPVGLTFSADGKLRGVPTVVGTYTFVIGVTDGQILGSKQYTVTVQNGISRLFVDRAATGDNNGSNWANAFMDIQPALELAGAGDEIWVAKGTYYTGPLAASTFKLKEGVKMYGGFAGTEAALADRDMATLRTANETILDGSQGIASYHVVSNALALTSATVLDGFSIQGGNATLMSGSNYQGGGIYNNLGAVQFSNLWIKNNSGTYGAGIYHNGDAVYTNIQFSNNQAKGTSARGAAVYNAKGFNLSKGVFENNKILESSSYPGYGAGIFSTGMLDLSEVEFKNNSILNGQGAAIYSNSSAVIKIKKGTFTGNKATTGGALFIASGTPVLEEVTFTDNTATAAGGAIYASGVLMLNRAAFIHNTATQHGGAIWSNSNLKIDNSIFSRNEITSTAAYYGGAIYINANDVLINNTSFSKNNIGYAKGTATLSYGGALYRNTGTVTLHNSILWGNTRMGTIADQLNVGVIVGNTIIQQDYATGTDVKIGDPLFLDAAADNLQLQGGSLAIDGGENSWQAYDKDLAGKARVINNTIDLGAYENESTDRLIINPEKIEAITRGTFLNLSFSYTGTSLPVTWSLQAGKLPPGVLLTTDGKLTGVPNIIGTYTFVVGATDGNLSGNRQYKVTVQNGTGRMYVHQAATGANNGSDWTNAFKDLQTAMELAGAGDEIWVAKGTYSAGPLAASTFKLKEGLKLYGGFAGTETTIEERDTLKIRTDNEAILDGSQGIASYHVVYNAAALTNATVLDGFSIQGGGSAVNTSNNSINFYGGGIYNSLGAAVFRKLWIKNNLGVYGAGLYHNGDATYTDVVFSNNRSTGYYARGAAVYNVKGFKLNKGVFENNRIIESSSYPGYGAAMFSTGVSDLNNIRFESNTLTNGQGGAIYVNSSAVTNLSNASFSGSKATTGGALYLASGTANLTNISFKDNIATASGGAIYAGGVLNIDRATFQNNISGQHGGSIWSSATLKISNTSFSRNKINSSAAYYGGAVFIYTGTATLTNTSFSKNSIGYYKIGTVNYGGGLYRNSGTVTLNNSILWGNTRGEGVPDQLNLNIKATNSLISGGYTTGLNIVDANPAFANADGDDLALTGCSPAINTGDNNLAPAGTVDRLGNPRIKAAVIDLGAIEYQSDVITLNPETLPQIPRGAAFNQQLQGVGGTGFYTYKLISGKLPDGLSMDASGMITGNPIVIGKYTFVINVSDGTMCGNRVYNMDVVAGTGVVRILVNQAATAGQNNGSTWDNAYLDLQSALKVSLAGDQIWVAKGTYSPGTLVTSYFTLKEGVKMYGGFGATESTLAERDSLKVRTVNETILTGNNNSRHVVYNYNVLTAATVLDGFSISGGRSVPSGTSTGEPYIGAGIYNRVGAATFNHLWIKNNNSNTYGGGMYNGGTSVISNVIFENNGTLNSSGSYRYGGGLYNIGAATFRQLEFINNTAAYGGGMYQGSATVTINDITFKDNKATLGGGFYSYSGKVTLNNAIFTGNTATQHGGGLYQWASTLTINNAEFSRNKVTGTGAYFGGAFYQYTSTSTLVNVSMSNNSIAYVNATINKYGGAIYKNAGTLNLHNSIVWANQRGNGVADELNLNIKPVNSLIRGGYAAGKVIVDKDPLFNLANEDDLSLSACSPAINMGDNALSVGILKDMAGQPRIKTEVVDMGAFENQQERINVGPTVLPEGLRGVLYEHQMVSSGGSGSYTYAVSYGSLPDGLLLSPSGRLSGRPINAGLYTFNITASDGSLCGNRLYTFEVKMGTGKVRIYVNQAATSGMNNSASWDHAFLDLQKGISSAMTGDTIFVAKGTYTPGLKVNNYFTLKEGVKIYGGFAATEKELADRDSTAIMTTNQTILDGANRSYHVVFNRLALTDATVLDGFTISGGKSANGSSTADPYNGGGIYNALGKVIFKNLWVKNNYAYYSGGGIFNSGTATFSNIILENNTVVQLGGGLYNNAAATFKNVKFIGNKGSQGGGMYHITAALDMKDVVFKNNTATATGGGFYNATNGKPTITNALFVGNTSAQHGGAIYHFTGTFNLINGAFSRNRTTVNGYYGGAYYHYTGTTNIVNATFSNNTSAYINASTTTKYGGALYRNTGTVNVANSIFWGNTRGNAVPDQMNAGILISTSTVQNGYVTGTTILTKDPQLANAAADDLSLAPCSPVVNMGDNTKITGTTKDLAGEDRIKHTTVDLGAYEFQGIYLENAEQQLPAADQWTNYSHQIQLAEGGAYTYTVSQGLLPDGLGLSSSGLISGEPTVAGDYEFTLAVQGADVCGSLKVKIKVNPRLAYIIQVLKPYPVPVKKDTGTPFDQLNLVTQVEVVMSDNSHARFPVTWLPGNYDGNVEGIYELIGTLIVPNPDVNRNNLTATAKVAVITPIYPYIIAVAELPPIKVLSGTPYSEVLPLLPRQAQVTYDDGVTKELLNLTWKQGDYNPKVGVYRLYATLGIKEEHANPADFEANVDVYVQHNIIAVEDLADITVDLHTPAENLPLPATVRVTYHDQTTGFLNVSWDRSPYIADKGAEYELKGTLQLSDLVTNTGQLFANNKVIIRKNIVSVLGQYTASTPYDTPFDEVILPEVVKVNFDDGTQDTVGVEWAPGTYNKLQSGNYTLTGTLLHNESIDNKSNIKAQMILTVLSKPKNIVSIAILDTVKVSYGTLLTAIPELKTAVQVTYDDGSTGMLNMTWDTEGYDPLVPEVYTFIGDPILIPGVVNKDAKTTEINIQVGNKKITTVQNPAAITVKYGTPMEDIAFPENVNVTYNDQSAGTEGVIWTSETYNAQLPGEYEFKGTVVTADDIDNPDNLVATIKVTVGPKPLEVDTVATSTVLVPFGTSFANAQPLFPAQVNVTYDNGSTGMLNVTWEEGDYMDDVPGMYELKGTLQLPEDILNPKNVEAVLMVTVGKHLIDTYTSPDTITVVFGTAPEAVTLPGQLSARFVDGGNEDLGVDWDLSPYNGNLAGSYVLNGSFTLTDQIENPKPVNPQIVVIVLPREKEIVALRTDTIKVEFGTSLESLQFPLMSKATLDDGSLIDIAVQDNSFKSLIYNGDAAAEYLFEGAITVPQGILNTNNLKPKVVVVVDRKQIETIETLPGISVDYGTEFDALTLPEAVKVTYNDASEELLSVTWAKGTYDGKVAGVYTLQGTIVVPDDADNPKGLQPVITVTVAERIKKLLSITRDTVEVSYGTLQADISFPATATGLFDDGSTMSLSVTTWANVDYDSTTPGSYEFSSEVVMPALTENPDSIKAFVNVKVAQRYIVSVTDPLAITVPYGTAFGTLMLPDTVMVTYNNDDQEALPVNWDGSTYNGLLAGEYILPGTLVPDSPEENKDNKTTTIKITVLPKLLVLDSVLLNTPLHFPFGTTEAQVLAQLGTQLDAIFTDGSTGKVAVSWESPLFNGNSPGAYNFTGLLDMEGKAENPDDITPKVEVIIDNKNVIAIESLVDLIDVYGKPFSALDLPATVMVTYDDQTTANLPVLWTESNYDATLLTPQVINGEIQLTDDVRNGTNLQPQIKLILWKDLLSVTDLAPITVKYGTPFANLGLPASIEVTYNDGSKEVLNITWDQAAYTAAAIGELELTAALTLSPNTFNTTEQVASVKITIEKATQTITFAPIGEKNYGDEPFKLTATASSGLPVTFELLDGKLDLNGDMATIEGAGNVVVKVSQAGNAFFAPAEAQQTFKINKAMLTVTGDTLVKYFGKENPPFTYHMKGFKYEETDTTVRADATLVGEPAFSTTATLTSPAGDYPLTLSLGTLQADNYEFTFEPGLLTVKNLYHTITFETMGGTPIDPIQVEDGAKIPVVTTTKSGMIFYTWFSDQLMETVFNFDAAITESMTLYADWTMAALPDSGPISMRTVADYMLGLNELTTTERAAPFSLSLLNGKSHLAKKTAPFKLSDWYSYGPMKKALLNTSTVIAKNETAVTVGITLLNNGGTALTASGICWSTDENPTLADTRVNAANIGDSQVLVDGLMVGVNYYLKAFVINQAGLSYGNELVFKIKEDGSVEMIKK
ncbi:polymorphic outer membrane protein repeat-containing protein [Pedobacter sp. ok626]|uniref:choice-of-anchor Q domain-containing protein n=1 Tax=Pedobacter sp. ok626 TaxID=1761882 RepID=UPI00088599C7|nr:choice-of-anchor Q domain-containing protein [Pedobacter sp. ok626]SDJ01445.1 polymorphic outer membrane protein repeat-containing protein [Pedobacter sp. ok626]